MRMPTLMGNFAVTLACLGAGIAPGIAEETAKTEKDWVLTYPQMDRITAGNLASVIRGDTSLKAIAEYQNTNSAFASSRAEVSQVSVSDGSGGSTNVLKFSGSVKTPDTVQNPTPVSPEPPAEPSFPNRAAQAFSQLLGR